jgi:hypothetical protein
VSNTDSDVFRVGTSGAVYYLVPAAGSLHPTSPVRGHSRRRRCLRISRRSRSTHRGRASSPRYHGTPEASEAVLIASIPQTARVSKSLDAPTVAYQGGTPDFQKIESTTVARALNTDKDVFLVGQLYYLCYQGVWFVSDTAAGPWKVTSHHPKRHLRDSTSSPAYNVTFVTAADDDDDEWVDFTAAAAYTGLMIGWGCAVWGSGYYYPPTSGTGARTFPTTPPMAIAPGTNPWTSSYGRAAGCTVRTAAQDRRALQRRNWHLLAGRSGVGSLRRRCRRSRLQPGHRNVCTRRSSPQDRTAHVAQRRLQPTHGRLRRDASGVRRLRELGDNIGPARRSVGQHVTSHEQQNRRDDPRH